MIPPTQCIHLEGCFLATIKRIQSLTGLGILEDRSAKQQEPLFQRWNLIYGFNGSGKSTLSRTFLSLQKAQIQSDLPDNCSFEIEFHDGKVYGTTTSLTGVEQKICVFNNDFIDENLQWDHGTANSIFYISESQASKVAELRLEEDRFHQKKPILNRLLRLEKHRATYFPGIARRERKQYTALAEWNHGVMRRPN